MEASAHLESMCMIPDRPINSGEGAMMGMLTVTNRQCNQTNNSLGETLLSVP